MRLPVALAVSLCSVAACGGGSEKSPAPTDSAASAAMAPSAVPAVITITARDFAFDVPDTVTGGLVTLKLVNQGPNLHHVQLLKLGEGKTYNDFTAAMKEMKPGMAPPSWIQDVAGPNSPVPGGEQTLTEELAPGSYAVVCFIDTPDKVPHFAKGMLHSLTVMPPAGPAPVAPVADINVAMTDYAWEIAPALTAGKHVIKIENKASQSHELFLVQLAAGKTADDMMKWAETYKGPPPGTPMGGISGMGAGGMAYLPVDLPSGEYLLLCFIPDAKDGKPHLAHGMLKTITVS